MSEFVYVVGTKSLKLCVIMLKSNKCTRRRFRNEPFFYGQK